VGILWKDFTKKASYCKLKSSILLFSYRHTITSCTMVQFVVGGALKKLVVGEDKVRRLTNFEQMGCGIGAGAVSSLIGSPLELIMIQQQRKGGNMIE
jgi:hypothetical protein